MDSSMDLAIEKGMGAKPTKTGSGDKEKGYEVKANILKRVFYGFAVIGALLLVTVLVYQNAFATEQKARIVQSVSNSIKHGKVSQQAIRLGASLQAVLKEQSESESVVRLLNRINTVVERKFTELETTVSQTGGEGIGATLLETRGFLLRFMKDEISDYQKEQEKEAARNAKQMSTVAKMQKNALRSILTSVSGGKVGALEDMLEEIFEGVNETPLIDLSASMVQELEVITDGLYDEAFSLHQGFTKIDDAEVKFSTDVISKLSKQKHEIRTAEDLADMLDELVEYAKVSTVREKMKALEEQFLKLTKMTKEQREKIAANEGGKDPTVEIMLKIQDLVNEGALPTTWLDFEELEVPYYDEEANENMIDEMDDYVETLHERAAHHGVDLSVPHPNEKQKESKDNSYL